MTLSGGEPTENKDFLKVLRYCHKNELEVVLHTSGLKVDKKLAQNLKPLVSRISLSLDGASQEAIYRMRKNKKILTQVLWLIDLLSDLRIPVSVKTLITSVNQGEIVAIGELLSNKKVKYWSLLEFNPINRGLVNKRRFYLSDRDFDMIIDLVRDKFPNLPIKVRRFRRKPENYCFIAADGKVYTYILGKGDILIGDLFKTDLGLILKQIPNSH